VISLVVDALESLCAEDELGLVPRGSLLEEVIGEGLGVVDDLGEVGHCRLLSEVCRDYYYAEQRSERAHACWSLRRRPRAWATIPS